MTGIFKRFVENALSLPLLGETVRRVMRCDTVVLAYHNIVPPGELPVGDRSLHLPARSFAEQLDVLETTHEIVPLSELVAPHPGKSGRPRAVVTFDDAYRGAVTTGIEMLAARGHPATVFVAPEFVGGRSFWWDVLSDQVGGYVDPDVRESALQQFRGRDALVRGNAERWRLVPAEMPPYAVAAAETELQAIAQVPGITLGSHSWGHPNLAALDGDELASELHAPLNWLRARFEAVVPWIAYPYGLYSNRVERAAEQCGYQGGFRIDGGCIRRPSTYAFSYPRINVPAGLSANGLRLRVNGMLNR